MVRGKDYPTFGQWGNFNFFTVAVVIKIHRPVSETARYFALLHFISHSWYSTFPIEVTALVNLQHSAVIITCNILSRLASIIS